MATSKDDKKAAEKKPAPAAKKKSTAPTKKPAESKPVAAKTAAAESSNETASPKAKPAAAAKSTPPAPAVEAVVSKENFTAEEKKRLAKLQATMELLNKDPEWASFLDEQKLALYDLRDQVAPNMQNVTRDHLRSGASNVSSASGQHMGDAGSEAEVRDLTIRLLDKDREQLYEIDAALERIRRGTYGICEESLDPIPKGRLRVRPFCRLTVKCQEEFEKKYGIASTYNSSNSEIIGYAGLQNIQESAISLDEDSE